MALPSHTDVAKQKARVLADTYLSQQAIRDAGLLDYAAVQQVLEQHSDANTSKSEQTQLDAISSYALYK